MSDEFTGTRVLVAGVGRCIARALQACVDAFGSAPDIAIFNVDSGPEEAFLDVDDETSLLPTPTLSWRCDGRSRPFPRICSNRAGAGFSPSALIQSNTRTASCHVLHKTTTYRAVGALALSKTLSAELGPFGVTVNTLGTGAIATSRFREVFSRIAEANGDFYEEHIAGRVAEWSIRCMGTIDDMAAAAVFLWSNLAGYITGQVLVVDGGNIESLQ